MSRATPRNIHGNPNAPNLSPHTYPSLQNHPVQSFSLWQLLVNSRVLWVSCCFFPSVSLCCYTPHMSDIIWYCLSPPDLFFWTFYRLAPSTSLQMVGLFSSYGCLLHFVNWISFFLFVCSLAMWFHHSSPGYEQQLCVNRYVSVSIYRSVCLHIYLSFYISFFLSLYPLYLSIHLSSFLSSIMCIIYRSSVIYLSVYLWNNLLSVCPSMLMYRTVNYINYVTSLHYAFKNIARSLGRRESTGLTETIADRISRVCLQNQ